MIAASNPRKPLSKPITDVQRDLYFQFFDGQFRDLKGMAALIHQQKHPEIILRFLLARGLKGKIFVEWYRERFSPNPAKMFQYVLSEARRQFTI